MLKELKRHLHEKVEAEKNKPSTLRNFIVESDIYRNPERFQQELAALVDTNLGPLEDLRLSKKYIINEDEHPKIFLNSCPHRGAHLNKSESGFRCAYHGWTFTADGKLESSTGPHCPFPKGALKLAEIPVTEVSGMMLTGSLSPLLKEIKTLFPHSKYLAKRSHQVACNWKFLVESLLETYHFPFAHSPYLEGFENAFFTERIQDHKNARLIVPLADLPEHLDTESLQGINIMSYVFPYSFILHMSSGFVWFHIIPVSAQHSVFNIYLFSYDRQEESARKSLDMLNKILDQDFEILERQQINTETPQRYHFTGYENLIKEFHRNIKEALIEKF